MNNKLYLYIAIIFLLCVIIVNSYSGNKTWCVSGGGCDNVLEESYSMRHTFLPSNTLVSYSVWGCSEVEVGDIVAYKVTPTDKVYEYTNHSVNNYYVIHRVMSIVDRQILFKGDNNDFYDGWISCYRPMHKIISIL